MKTPTTPTTLSMISRCCPRFFAFTVAIALGCAVAASLHGQPASGAIVGIVIDDGTSAYLEGAEVTVVGTALTATTDRTGRFELRAVPLGSAQLSVAYPGLPGATASATVFS